MLEVLEMMRLVLFCMLEAVEGDLCWLEVLEVTCCVLLHMLEAVDGKLCLLEVLEVMRCVLLRIGGCGAWALFGGGVRDVGGAGGDAPCAGLYARGQGW